MPEEDIQRLYKLIGELGQQINLNNIEVIRSINSVDIKVGILNNKVSNLEEADLQNRVKEIELNQSHCPARKQMEEGVRANRIAIYAIGISAGCAVVSTAISIILAL